MNTVLKLSWHANVKYELIRDKDKPSMQNAKVHNWKIQRSSIFRTITETNPQKNVKIYHDQTVHLIS